MDARTEKQIQQIGRKKGRLVVYLEGPDGPSEFVGDAGRGVIVVPLSLGSCCLP